MFAPQPEMVNVNEMEEERAGLMVEAARFLRRKARKYFRQARSFVSRRDN
jgi:hypothetical protein